MKKFVFLGIVLVVGLTSAYGSNGLMEKYRHNYLALEEADVDSIIKLLNSPDPSVRRQSTALIGMAFYKRFPSAKKAVPRLIELVNTDSSVAVRAVAADVLPRSGDKNAIESLLRLARDENLDPGLLAALFRGLSERAAGDKVIIRIAKENLRSSNLELRYESIRMLARSGERQDLKRLLQEYVDFHERPDSSLKKIGPGGPRSLHKNRFDELSHLLSTYLIGLARCAPDLLEPLLNHANPKFKLDAAIAFAFQRDQRAIPVLIGTLRSSKTWNYRSEAARALGFYRRRHLGANEEAVMTALKEALDDEHAEQGQGGPYRPVACRAYRTLLMLGMEVEEPEGLKYEPFYE